MEEKFDLEEIKALIGEPDELTPDDELEDIAQSIHTSVMAKHTAPPARRRKRRRWIKVTAICAGALLALYLIAVYSDIPFIKKWRTIWIETAMDTMTHQWLATDFIPKSVIDKVMEERKDVEDRQKDMRTDWVVVPRGEDEKKASWSELNPEFFEKYPDVDRESFEKYLDAHFDECFTEDGYLLIDRAGLDDEGTGIRTVQGDEILAIDTVNGITIVKIKGGDYVARMAIVNRASQIRLQMAPNYKEVGVTISKICSTAGAVLAINANGFYDPEGHGNGGIPYGLAISDGVICSPASLGRYKAIGFDRNDILQIGQYSESMGLRDATEFRPILVLNGEAVISGSAGWGISPRTAMGQTPDGRVLMLVVDGRQAGYSLGCTMGDLASMMVRYGAYQACNLDGGSSSIMYYRGRKITRPSAGDRENGRRLPNGFVVMPR